MNRVVKIIIILICILIIIGSAWWYINKKNKIFNVHRENGAKRYIFGAYNDVLNFIEI